MTPTETTPDRLVFEENPTTQIGIAVAATLVFGALALAAFARGIDAGVIFLVFAVSGPVYAFFFVEARSVVLDRRAGTVAWRRRGLRGETRAERPLSELRGAEVHRPGRPENRVVALDSEVDKAVPVRAVLAFQDGSFAPLDEGFRPGVGAFEAANAINAWLGPPG